LSAVCFGMMDGKWFPITLFVLVVLFQH
jgi:hypothetical protein